MRETGSDASAADPMRCERPGMDTRVLVVDDHASFRSIARRVLAADGFLVVGEASAGAGPAMRRLLPEPERTLPSAIRTTPNAWARWRILSESVRRRARRRCGARGPGSAGSGAGPPCPARSEP